MDICAYIEKNRTAAGIKVGDEADFIAIVGGEIYEDLCKKAAMKIAIEVLPNATFVERKNFAKTVDRNLCRTMVDRQLHEKFLQIDEISF